MRQNLGDEETKKKKTRILLTVVAGLVDGACENVAGGCLVVVFFGAGQITELRFIGKLVFLCCRKCCKYCC